MSSNNIQTQKLIKHFNCFKMCRCYNILEEIVFQLIIMILSFIDFVKLL